MFCCAKNIRINSTDYFIMKIPNKREPQKISVNQLSDIDIKDFLDFHKKIHCKNNFFLGKLYHIAISEWIPKVLDAIS